MTAVPPGTQDGDEGRAIVEVVVLGVLILIPLAYVLLIVIHLQSASLAVAQAARDVGRVMDSAPSAAVGLDRAQQIAALALADQGLSTEQLSVYFVGPAADCDSSRITPTIAAGTVMTVCVRTVVTLPGVPSVLSGSQNTVTGLYTLQLGELREG